MNDSAFSATGDLVDDRRALLSFHHVSLLSVKHGN